MRPHEEFLKIKKEVESTYPNFASDEYIPSHILPKFKNAVRELQKNMENRLREIIGMSELP